MSSEGNFTDEQAEALTQHLRNVASLNAEHLASKEEIGQFETSIRTEIRHLKTFLTQDVTALRS
ncbi:MAG: hypothetical protein AAFX06_33585, partial [Planctomycetota bacterium]